MSNYSDKYYHESGHVIITRLFEESLTMKFVTVDEKTSNQFDHDSKGGVRASSAILLADRTVLDHDKAILSFFAGLCADLLVEKSRNIQTEFYDSSIWFEKLQNDNNYSGDRDLIGSTFSLIKDRITLSQKEYFVSCIKALFEILNNEIVWEALSSVRDELIKKHTLNTAEIDEIILNKGFDSWKKQNKAAIISDREILLVKRTSANSTLPKAGRSWWQKLFSSYKN